LSFQADGERLRKKHRKTGKAEIDRGREREREREKETRKNLIRVMILV
jgi:hypothetical protein